MFKIGTLNNKIKYLLAPLKETQAVTVLVLVKVGSRYEPAKLNGIAHFIEHLLFKGTKKRPTSLEISKELDGIGADYNAFTSKQHTGYYIKAGKQHLALAIEILSDILFNSLFDAKEMERERGVIIEEINMYEDNPLMYIRDLLEQTIYANHPLGRKISGEKENVKKISRREIINFFQDNYSGSRLVIGLGGNFKETEAKKLLEKYFGHSASAGAKSVFKKYADKQKSARIKLLKKDTQQSQVALGFPAYKNTSPKVYALTLLAIILGGGMSSRLFTEVREKRGLCYFIRADANFYEDTGSLVIQSGLDLSRLKEALEIIKKELIKIKRQGVTKDELSRAKEFLKGKTILQLEDSAQLIDWLAEQQLLKGKVDGLDSAIKKAEAVTLKEIKKTAGEIIRFNKISLAVIGPKTDKQKLLNIFK